MHEHAPDHRAHRSVSEELVRRLVGAYRGVKIGNPLDDGTLMGPLLNEASVETMQAGARLPAGRGRRGPLRGATVLDGDDHPGGRYVVPAIARAENSYQIVQDETFAPILYIIEYGPARTRPPAQAIAELEEAIEIHNDVPQGLSSAIFTDNVREAEYFLSHRGSDCGIANCEHRDVGGPRSGAPSAVRRTLGAAESRDRTRGRRTCAVRRTR